MSGFVEFSGPREIERGRIGQGFEHLAHRLLPGRRHRSSVHVPGQGDAGADQVALLALDQSQNQPGLGLNRGRKLWSFQSTFGIELRPGRGRRWSGTHEQRQPGIQQLLLGRTMSQFAG